MTTPAPPVDISPMVFTKFVSKGRRYRTMKPLVFTFEYVEEDGKGIYLFEGEYNIISGAYSREEAWEMIEDALTVMWESYAEGLSDQMTIGAQELGKRLRDRFELVADAS